MILLKVAIKQAFTISLENVILENWPPGFLGLRHLSHVDSKKKEDHFSSFIVSNFIIIISGITVTKVEVVVMPVVVAVVVAVVEVATAMADVYDNYYLSLYYLFILLWGMALKVISQLEKTFKINYKTTCLTTTTTSATPWARAFTRGILKLYKTCGLLFCKQYLENLLKIPLEELSFLEITLSKSLYLC